MFRYQFLRRLKGHNVTTENMRGSMTIGGGPAERRLFLCREGHPPVPLLWTRDDDVLTMAEVASTLRRLGISLTDF
jgi:hypothetical protein